MVSERIQRRIERLLDQAEEAADKEDWLQSAARAREALALDGESRDAQALLTAAEKMLGTGEPPSSVTQPAPAPPASAQPTSFVNGRYEVSRFLGEGGKKKVYLAHDSLLDRDVAFALIKTEGLDDEGRQRITREAQAMGRLGNHLSGHSAIWFFAVQFESSRANGESAAHPFKQTGFYIEGEACNPDAGQ